MICPSCDTLNREDAKFCKKCGHSFHTGDTKTSEAAVVSQVAVPAEGNLNGADDPDLAPTQIISPQQMLAFHANRWQRDVEGERSGPLEQTSAQRSAGESGPGDEENIPTLISTQIPDVSSVAGQPAQDISTSMNAGTTPAATPVASELVSTPPQPATPDEEPIPPPPPHVAATASTATPAAQNAGQPAQEGQPIPAMAANTASSPQQESPAVAHTPAEQPEHATSNGDFPVLPVGAMVNERYEVTQVVSEDRQEHIYDVLDQQGYRHCWNCGSEQNSEGDEFCIDCGAELLNATYTMHEYPSTGGQETEANVLHGTIINTFVEHERTYVIEQVQAIENAFPNGVHLIAACDSDAGNVRRSDPNEDSTLVLMFQRIHESKSWPAGVFIVADGMGGHDNGQLASRMAINTLAERMVRELLGTPLAHEKAGEAEKERDEDAYVALLQGAVEDANAAICQVNQRDKTDMGSTITGFMIVGDYAYILNVGDSRTYMIRGGQIYQLTNDHSLVGQLVAGGLIAPEDVYTHPQRSQIFRSLGDRLNVQIDIFKQQLHPGDILLSCSDGLWEMVRDPQIESILNNAPDPQVACTQLIDAANANGGEDNVSAVVVFVR